MGWSTRISPRGHHMFDDREREVSTFLFDLLFAVSFEKHSEKYTHKYYTKLQ